MKLYGKLIAADCSDKEIVVLVPTGITGVTIGAPVTIIIHDKTNPIQPVKEEREPGE